MRTDAREDSMPLFLFAFIEQIECLLQFGDLVLNDIPEDSIVDPEIGMGNDITETGRFAPIDFRHQYLDGRRDILCSFTDDLKITHNGIIGLLIGRKLPAGHSISVCPDLAATSEDVIEIERPVTRH